MASNHPSVLTNGGPKTPHINVYTVKHRVQTPRIRIVLFRGVCFFRHIFVIFRAFYLVILRNLVYLQTVKGG